MAILLQRWRSRRLRKRLALIGWLCLAAIIALYGITMFVALVGGVNLRPLVLPALRLLVRPIEIAAVVLYPLVCWLGWFRRSLAPSWDLGEGVTRAPFLENGGVGQGPLPVSRWRRLLYVNIHGLFYTVVGIPAAIAILTLYGITSLQTDGLAAFLSRWNYPLAGLHIVAGCICFIAWRAPPTRGGRRRPGELA